MKSILQKLVLGAAFLGSITATIAAPVVFNVNMSVQSAIGTFNPSNGDTVSVLGLNGNWDTAIGMVPSANPDIYTMTNDLTVESWPNFKFVITPTNSAWIWESPTSTGGGNRWFQVPAGGTNLPTFYFSDNTNLPSSPIEITFQVNMQYAILNGQFNPAALEYVSAFGSFDNWGQTGVLLTNVPGTSNYVGTLTSSTLTTNTSVAYKFAKNGYGGTWEGNVGPNGAADRTFTITNTTMVLPLVYWNNVSSFLGSHTVRFAVDMTAQDALGVFTPGGNTVFVNGDWDWGGAAFQLTQVGSSDVYTGAVALAFAPGSTVNYKYTIDGGLIWENDGVGPAGARNHQFVITGNTNLPTDYFNNRRDLGPLSISREGAQTILSWPAGTNVNNRIRLQNSTSLSGGWSDVPNTQGQSSITNDFGPGPSYFRLIGP